MATLSWSDRLDKILDTGLGIAATRLAGGNSETVQPVVVQTPAATSTAMPSWLLPVGIGLAVVVAVALLWKTLFGK